MYESMPEGLATSQGFRPSGHRRILASAVLLGGTAVLVKLIALAKDWLVAKRFGAGDDLDAFLVALVIPTFAVAVLAHSFASGFMPTYIRVWQRQGLAAAQRLVEGALAAAIGILFLITLTLAALARYLIPLVATGFDPAKLALCESLFYVLTLILMVTGLSAVFASVLNAHERFEITAASSLAVPVATLVVFWAWQDRWGIHALALGTLLGYVLECALLAGGMHRRGLLMWPKWGGLDDELRHVRLQYLPIAMAALLMNSSIVVDQTMAASLGSGNVSLLSYGGKLVAVVLTIVALSLSTVLFPRFSRLITAGQWDELDRTIRGYSKAILMVSIPAVALMAYVSEPLVRLVFQRGAFTPDTTRAVSQVQLCLLPQIPLAVLATLGCRVLSALDGNPTVLRIGVLSVLLNVGGNLLLMHFFGVNGIALSTSLTYLAIAAVTMAAIQSKLAEARSKADISH